MTGGISPSRPLLPSSLLRVDEVPGSVLRPLGAQGHLGMTLLPGRCGWSRWSATWHQRGLDTDLDQLASLYQGGAVVSLVEAHEYPAWGLPGEAGYHQALAARGVRLLSLPVPDLGTPVPAQRLAWRSLVLHLAKAVRAGEPVVAHALGGLGRTGMLVACVLVELGLSPSQAVRDTRAARPGAIQTAEQREQVSRYALWAETRHRGRQGDGAFPQ